MRFLNLIKQYLYITPQNNDSAPTEPIKYMHCINRISLITFLMAMALLFARYFARQL